MDLREMNPELKYGGTSFFSICMEIFPKKIPAGPKTLWWILWSRSSILWLIRYCGYFLEMTVIAILRLFPILRFYPKMTVIWYWDFFVDTVVFDTLVSDTVVFERFIKIASAVQTYFEIVRLFIPPTPFVRQYWLWHEWGEEDYFDLAHYILIWPIILQ